MKNSTQPRAALRRRVRGQAAELRDLFRRLQSKRLSKMDVLREGRPALAFNISKLIAQLRRAGFRIVSSWDKGRDAQGHSIRFKRYWLG